MFAPMGLSTFKLILILGVVTILFLPVLIRRAYGLPALFEQFRARIAGEESAGDKNTEALRAAIHKNTKPSMAKRFGGMLARVITRIKPRRVKSLWCRMKDGNAELS
jgi:hypothetical protein